MSKYKFPVGMTGEQLCELARQRGGCQLDKQSQDEHEPSDELRDGGDGSKGEGDPDGLNS